MWNLRLGEDRPQALGLKPAGCVWDVTLIATLSHLQGGSFQARTQTLSLFLEQLYGVEDTIISFTFRRPLARSPLFSRTNHSTLGTVVPIPSLT